MLIAGIIFPVIWEIWVYIPVPEGYRGLFLLVLCAYFLLNDLFKNRKSRIYLNKSTLVLIILSAFMFWSVRWTTNAYWGSFKAKLFVLYGVAPFLIGIGTIDNPKYEKLLFAFGFLVSIYYIFLLRTYGNYYGSGHVVFGGDYGDTIWNARMLGFGVLSLYYLMLLYPCKNVIIIGAVMVASGMGIYFIVLTGARGPLLAVFAAVAASESVLARKRLVILAAKVGICISIISIGGFYAFKTGIWATEKYGLNRLSQDVYTVDSRVAYWKDSFEPFKKNVLLGVGSGGYQTGRSIQSAANDYGRDYPHNIFVETAVEYGSAGIVMFLFLLQKALNKAWLIYSNHDKGHMFALGVFIFGFVNATMSGDIISNQCFWYGLGMLSTTTRNAGK